MSTLCCSLRVFRCLACSQPFDVTFLPAGPIHPSESAAHTHGGGATAATAAAVSTKAHEGAPDDTSSDGRAATSSLGGSTGPLDESSSTGEQSQAEDHPLAKLDASLASIEQDLAAVLLAPATGANASLLVDKSMQLLSVASSVVAEMASVVSSHGMDATAAAAAERILFVADTIATRFFALADEPTTSVTQRIEAGQRAVNLTLALTDVLALSLFPGESTRSNKTSVSLRELSAGNTTVAAFGVVHNSMQTDGFSVTVNTTESQIRVPPLGDLLSNVPEHCTAQLAVVVAQTPNPHILSKQA